MYNGKMGINWLNPEEVANTPNQQDLVVLIIATITTPLDRFELRKLLFPIAKHMRLDAT